MKNLLKPFKINELEIKNRMIMPAIHHLYTPDGYVTDRFKEYYYTRAEGGVGLIIIGGCKFDDFGGTKSMISIKDDSFIPGLKEFTEGIHKRGSKVAVQLYHAGRYTRKENLPEGKEALAPSAVYSKYSRETPKAMTKEEIDLTIKAWAAASLRAKKAGFDAVEILGSAGYLISQFLSPVTNLREDEYGGSWENRCRFPKEVIAAVRKAVGPDYPIIMRIAGNDFMKGSNTNEDAVRFAKVIEEAGIDFINVTGGWHETTVPQIPGEVPRGGFAYLANNIKQAVSIPVMASNRFNDPKEAEKVLALKMADAIGFGRPLIADPELPNKVIEGKLDEIRQCVGCNQGCLAKTFFGKSIQCSVNGLAGREYKLKKEKVETAKNILVVGGGPGGMEAAIILTESGHDVTLWEKDSKLGGQLHLVSAPPGKEEWRCLINNQSNMIDRLNIKVELNKKANADDVISGNFDEVIIATGAYPNFINLPNNEGKIDIITAADVLSGKYIPGKNVVVVGGGSVGCETAQLLAEEGTISKEQLMFLSVHKAEKQEKIDELLNNSVRNVSIVEIQKKIGAGFDLGTGWPVMKQLKRLGVKKYTLSNVQKITDSAVVIEKEGEIVEIPSDTIVLAVGSKSENKLYESLKGKVKKLHIIGDAKKVGKVIDVIKEATDLALTI